MRHPLFLYSTNVLLAYKISKIYYGDLHYVWCSTEFGSLSVTGTLMSGPFSSLPLARYHTLQKEVESGDLHGSLISEAKLGLQRGASIKYQQRKITEAERDDIFLTVQKSPITEFKPLIYNIPWSEVEHLLEPVPVLSAARPTSIEYIIQELPGSKFDILDYHGI